MANRKHWRRKSEGFDADFSCRQREGKSPAQVCGTLQMHHTCNLQILTITTSLHRRILLMLDTISFA